MELHFRGKSIETSRWAYHCLGLVTCGILDLFFLGCGTAKTDSMGSDAQIDSAHSDRERQSDLKMVTTTRQNFAKKQTDDPQNYSAKTRLCQVANGLTNRCENDMTEFIGVSNLRALTTKNPPSIINILLKSRYWT